ncbi:MAG: hypothetical protein J2P46_13995 [Zavarzinella sp.]|nr:hypothetical protein [Zavarzinella sp.]
MSAIPERPTPDYLVTYGHGGFLGRFRSATELRRDDRVVIRTVRGVELGTVLAESARPLPGPDLGGEVLRLAGADDESAAAALATRAASILADAQATAESLSLPLLFLDGEILLDGPAILQAVHWADCDATGLFEQLSARHGLRIQLADLTTAPKSPARVCDTCGEEKSGCSDCGSGGGCSTGSCAKGSVKSAEELTAYFAGLRRQMEAAAARVPIHSQ